MTARMASTTETVRVWDARAQIWNTVTVPAYGPPKPRRRKRTTAPRRGLPRDDSGLSGGSPFAASLAYTAYDQEWSGPLADMRTWVKPATMRTHRAATVMPTDPGRVTDTMSKRELRNTTR